MSAIPLGPAAAAGTAVLWTFSALAWTSAGRQIGALAVSFLRLVLATGLLCGHLRLVHGYWLPVDTPAQTWFALGTSGLLGFFLSDLCLVKAFLLIGTRRSLLIQSLVPPMTAVCSWVYLGEAMVPRQWLGMAVTLAGVAWVLRERAEEVACPPQAWRSGLALALLAAVAQSVGFVLTKEGLGDSDVMAATFIRIAGGIAGYVVLVTVLGRWKAMSQAVLQVRPMAIVAAGSVIGPFVGVALSLVALRHCPAGVATTIFNTTPVLILPFAVFLYRERLTVRAVAGAVVAVCGVAMIGQ